MSASQTHPFIDFAFDTKTIDANTWLALGEGMSKCQHLAGVPLKPQAATEMSKVFLARGIQATTAIEGNTLSEEEVKQIVDVGTANVSESRAYLEQEVQNILGAISETDSALREGLTLPITVERLCALNAQVLEDIPDKPDVAPGEFRQHNVSAGRYRAPDWSDVPDLVQGLVQWLAVLRSQVSSEARREDRFVAAVLAAVLAHLYIAWIHPFGDGNGRVARLVEVQILSESGVVPIVATNLLADHYNKTRDAYYLALDAAQQGPTQFIRYSVRGFVDELREQVTMLRHENLAIHWESLVYEKFRDKPSTDARHRQRLLALALLPDARITPEEVAELTPRLARLYAKTGARTPARDLNDLVKMDLVEKSSHRRYRVLREAVEAFIPPVSG